MTANSFVAFVAPQHNTRGGTKAQEVAEQGGAGFDAVRVVWKVDAFLWLATGVSVALIAVEKFSGVMSGFTLLLGPTPALLLGVSLIVGGAAYLAAATQAGDRLQRAMAPVRFPRRPAAATLEATAPQWKVRTQLRSQRARGAASQRVMDMEV